MKKKSGKSLNVVALEHEPISTMRLEGKEAKGTIHLPVGAKTQFIVNAIKKAHSMDSMGHSASFSISKSTPSTKKSFKIYKKGK